MDRPGLITRGLGHALCRSARGRSQQYLHVLLFEIPDDRGDRGGFTCAGSPGDDQKAIFYSLCHRFPLMGVQHDIGLGLNPAKPLLQFNVRHIVADIEIMQHFCRI